MPLVTEGLEAYANGFVAGRVVAYCEQVKTGSRLAGQVNCDSGQVDEMVALIMSEGCLYIVADDGDSQRTAIWIYRDLFVGQIIHSVDALPNSPFGWWAMGKLLGYADSEILNYVKEKAKSL